MAVQWGNVAEWLAATFTGFAFLVTLILLRQEMHARAATEQDRRREDAERVAAWWHFGESMGSSEDEVVINVRNAGDTPVYDAVVFIGPAIEPIPYPSRNAIDVHIGIIPPEETAKEAIPARTVELDIESEEPDEHGFYRGGFIELAFTDSSGRFWRRNRRGQLEQRKGRSLDS